MALEGQRKIEHGWLQQLAFGAQLVSRDGLQFRTERGVENLHVLGVGAAGLGGERLVAGEQRHGRAGQHEARLTDEQATCSDGLGI